MKSAIESASVHARIRCDHVRCDQVSFIWSLHIQRVYLFVAVRLLLTASTPFILCARATRCSIAFVHLNIRSTIHCIASHSNDGMELKVFNKHILKMILHDSIRKWLTLIKLQSTLKWKHFQLNWSGFEYFFLFSSWFYIYLLHDKRFFFHWLILSHFENWSFSIEKKL